MFIKYEEHLEIVQHKQYKPTLTWRECYPITFGVKKPANLR